MQKDEKITSFLLLGCSFARTKLFLSVEDFSSSFRASEYDCINISSPSSLSPDGSATLLSSSDSSAIFNHYVIIRTKAIWERYKFVTCSILNSMHTCFFLFQFSVSFFLFSFLKKRKRKRIALCRERERELLCISAENLVWSWRHLT